MAATVATAAPEMAPKQALRTIVMVPTAALDVRHVDDPGDAEGKGHRQSDEDQKKECGKQDHFSSRELRAQAILTKAWNAARTSAATTSA